MCVDLNNNTSNRIHTYEDGIPHGVCCDKVGDIYVIVVYITVHEYAICSRCRLEIYHYSAGTNPEVKVTENNHVEDISFMISHILLMVNSH